MLKHIFSTESKTVTGAALLIAGAALTSRLVGVARDRVFAHYFGASPVMDAYYAAFKFPDLIYNLLIVGALTAGFIPTFTKLFYQGSDKTPAWKLANNVINIVFVVLLLTVCLGLVFTAPLMSVVAPGFTGERLTLVTTFTRIMFFSPLLLGISMVLGGILQSLRQFVLYSIAPIFYNLGIIFGAVFLVRPLGPAGLAWGVVLGALLHAAIQTIGAYANGYRWKWEWNLKDPATRQIGRLMLPRTVGLAFTQINNIIVTTLASLLAVGSVTIYNFADNLQAVPTGLIAIPFALAVFPVLSNLSAPADRPQFIAWVSGTARKILFLIVPVMMAMLILRAQIVRVVYGTGAFGWGATIATADALAFFALGLIGQALIPLFVRAFFALSDSKTPFFISIVSEITTIIFSLLLMKPLGVAGLALGSSIGDLLNCLLLVFYLRRTLGRMSGHSNVIFMYKVIGSAIGMGVVMQVLKYPLSGLFDLTRFWGILLQGLVSGIIGLSTYALLCRLLKVDEMSDFVLSFKKKWLKIWNLPASIDEAEKV